MYKSHIVEQALNTQRNTHPRIEALMDLYSAHAMQSLILTEKEATIQAIVHLSFTLAERMLKERLARYGEILGNTVSED